MKRAFVISAILLLAAGDFAAMPLIKHGGVTVARTRGLVHTTEAYLYIDAWDDSALTANLDSALDEVKDIDVLILDKPDCRAVDALRLAEVAGRFTPWDLQVIQPTGTWQWNKPLIITLKDSTTCPLFLKLLQRRWTEVLIGDEASHTREHARDMAKRWKREREDRMEKLFQK